MQQQVLRCILTLFCGLLLFGCGQENEQPPASSPAPPNQETGSQQPRPSLDTPKEELSYALGQEIGSTLTEIRTEIDFKSFSQGIEDSLTGREPLVTPERGEEVKRAFLEKLQQDYAAQIAELSQKNLEAGQAFLAENKLKENVVAQPSGLQYEVVEPGQGAQPGPQEVVRVHYRGTLLDGTVFDSSYERGEPALFKVEEVIPGLAEGLQLMQVGSTYRFFIPPDLAYGEEGAGPQIGPNETLIFEVDLVGIEEQAEPQPEPAPPLPEGSGTTG